MHPWLSGRFLSPDPLSIYKHILLLFLGNGFWFLCMLMCVCVWFVVDWVRSSSLPQKECIFDEEFYCFCQMGFDSYACWICVYRVLRYMGREVNVTHFVSFICFGIECGLMKVYVRCLGFLSHSSCVCWFVWVTNFSFLIIQQDSAILVFTFLSL